MIVAAACQRLWFGAHHGLFYDESYYWQWSRHLDYGYYDNTPLAAFVIRFFTSILGDSVFGLRFGAVFCTTLATVLAYLLARKTSGERAAFYTALILTVIPLAANAGFIMTYDPPMLAFWSLAVYSAWFSVNLPQTSSQNRIKAALSWSLTGILAGLAIMSKLNGLIILPALFCYLLFAENGRPWLKRFEPYLGAIISLVLFAPFLWWNHTHQNAYWQHGHAMSLRGTDKPFYIFANLGDFLGGQALVFSPLIYLTYLRLAVWLKNAPKIIKQDDWLFLWILSFSVTFVNAAVSLHNKVEANWAMTAYMTGAVLIGTLMANPENSIKLRHWHIASLIVAAFLSAAVFILPTAAEKLKVDIDPNIDRTAEMYGWDQVARRVEAEYAAVGGPEKAFVFGVNYRIPSILTYYMPGHPTLYSLPLHERFNNYMFWDNANKKTGENAVFVNDGLSPTEKLEDCREVFAKVEPQPPILVRKREDGPPIRTLQVFRCYNFKGYDPNKLHDGW